MNPIRPQPYPQRGNGNYNAGQQDTDKDGQHQNEHEQRRQNNGVIANGRAEDVQAQAVTRQGIYSPAANAYSQNPNSYMSQQTGMVQNYPVPSGQQINIQQYQAMGAGYQPIQNAPAQNPTPQNYTKRSNKVNIAQIIKDFRNTMKAIATPQELEADVNHYLEIVDQQVKSPQPQVNIIQSNLKIAASILDKYISDTLHKESKVVQNWLNALFLQKINYSYDESEVNPTFSVQFQHTNENETKQEEINANNSVANNSVQPVNNEPEVIEDNVVNQKDEIEDYVSENIEEEYLQAKQIISNKPNITIVPHDTKLKSLFMEAKKQAFSNNPQRAMIIFKQAFNRAEEIRDTETQSRICLEVGKIYNDNDFVVQALNSYNKSLQYTTDTNVKSHAHYSIAQIYDDVNQVAAALDHYITSISYAGKTDDLIGQSDSLTKVANIYTDKYDENAFEYYDIARKLIEQTTDDNMKGYVLSNTADACVQFKKKDKALKYYAEAVKNYEKTNSAEEIAENYKAAAELMIQFNSPNKARSLLKKAIVNAVKTSNEDLISEINLLLASVSE